jgi:transcriptional regulator with XRE-family HTH domain
VSITPAQASVARKLLGWSRARLSARAAVSEGTIQNLEDGRRPANRKIVAIQRALEAAGIEFTDDGEPGVTLKAKAKAQTDRG